MSVEEKITARELKMLMEHLKDSIKLLLEPFGFSHLNYTQKQLEAIENKIDKEFPEGHRPKTLATLIPFGYYLGECIIKNIEGSSWDIPDDAEEIFDIRVRIAAKDGKGSVVYPFKRVQKYWFDRTDKLSILLQMIEFMNEMSLDVDYQEKRAEEEGWIQTNFGLKFRMHIQDKENGAIKGVGHEGTISNEDAKKFFNGRK